MRKNLSYLASSILFIYLQSISSIQHYKVNVLNDKTIDKADRSKLIRNDVSTSVIVSSAKKITNNVKETFFARINEHNKEAFELLNQLWHSKAGWQHVTTKDGVSVQRRSLPAGSFVDSSDAEKGSIMMNIGIIKASPESVIKLFMDNSRVAEYNEHCIQSKDIQTFPKKPTDNSWTKLSWASGPTYGPFKARDFVSVVNYRRYQNGTFMIINRPAYVPSYPPVRKYVRATTLMVGNIIEPFTGAADEKYTRLTQVAHINPGGAADTAAAAYVINKLCAIGPPNFIRKLETAAQKSDQKNTIKNRFDNKWTRLKVPAELTRHMEKMSGEKKKLVAAFAHSKKKNFK